MKKSTKVSLGVAGGLVLIGAIAGCNSNSGSTASMSGSPAVTASAPPASTAPTQAPVPTTQPPAPTTQAPTPQAPSTPAMTLSQQQAVQSAQSYLSGGQGFSKQGLLKQLTSSFGEGFAKSDAEFAINYLHPDWNQQAVQSAQSYLGGRQGFSKKGLLKQLTSSYGEGFTETQALYAINYLHPDWNQQAVESAQGYLSGGQGFSRASLIQQLTSSYGEGFTETQALYAVNKVGL